MFKFILCAFLFISLNTYAAYQPTTSATITNTSSNPVPVNIVSGSVSVNTSGLATEVTLSNVETNTGDILTSSQNIEGYLNTINGKLPSLGQAPMVTSIPVAIASNQSALSVTLPSETTKVIGTVNQGTSPWVTSLASTTISSGTVALGSGSNLIGNVGISGQPLFSLGAVSTTGAINSAQSGAWSVTANAGTNLNTSTISGTVALNPNQTVLVGGQPLVSIGAVSSTANFNGSITGVSTTTALPVTVGAGSSFSLSGVSTTSPMVVNQGTSPWLVSGTIAINPNQTILAVQSGAWSVTANAGTNLNTSAISGTVAFNPNQSILSITSDYTPTSTVSSTDAINTSFAFRLSNTARTGFEAMNTTDATCWLRFSSSAATSATMTVMLLPLSGYYNMPKPIYTGQINAICSANGTTGKLNNTEKP